VLHAAEALFVDPGYAATTLNAVAARAGVSVQTVYKVFGSKKALLSALVDVTVWRKNLEDRFASMPRAHAGVTVRVPVGWMEES
jgi:AcrR family transcriptional regulator